MRKLTPRKPGWLLTLFILLGGCGNPEGTVPPGGCQLKDLGDAASLDFQTLPKNQYVRIQGISDPKTLIWFDSAKVVHYATKLLGCKGRLFYTKALKANEKPAIKSEFIGTLVPFSQLSDDFAKTLTIQYRTKWGVKIEPDNSFMILGGQKPSTCR